MSDPRIPFAIPQDRQDAALAAIGNPNRNGEYTREQVRRYRGPTCNCGAATVVEWHPIPPGLGFVPGLLKCTDPERHF